MTEELSLNDDPDSLMIEDTSTLGLPNISDITRFKIDFELPAGKIHIFQNSQLQLVTTNFLSILQIFGTVCFIGEHSK